VLKVTFRIFFAVLFIVGLTAPAAATSYRYWGFFTGSDGAWTMALVGANENIPTDGSVDGWRFGVGTDTQTPEPREMPDFEAMCPGSEQVEGLTRVAVVIDFGDLEQAPSGETPPTNRVECITMPTGGSSADALAMAANVRADGGFVCGIEGFPANECGAEVTDLNTEAQSETTAVEEVDEIPQSEVINEGGNTLIYAGVITVIVLVIVFSVSRNKK